MTPQSQYKELLEQGSLLELYPSMTGDWEADKKFFKEIWDLEQFYINDIEVGDYEEF
jgi:hypothetical protein